MAGTDHKSFQVRRHLWRSPVYPHAQKQGLIQNMNKFLWAFSLGSALGISKGFVKNQGSSKAKIGIHVT